MYLFKLANTRALNDSDANREIGTVYGGLTLLSKYPDRSYIEPAR